MGAQVTDLVLLARWARLGDAEAFNQIAVRHAGMVYSVCRRMLRDAVEAEDAAQECFEKLVQCPDAPREQVGGWLHAVAVSKSLNRLKARQRRTEREARYASERGDSEDVDWDDLYEHVDEALAELPEAMRTPIVLHFFEGQTHEAIASELGITRSGVTRRIERGIERLRKNLRGKVVAVTSVAALTAGLRGMTVAEAAPVGVLTAAARLALAGPAAPAAAGTFLGALASFALSTKMFLFAAIVVAGLFGMWAVKWRVSDSPVEAFGSSAGPTRGLAHENVGQAAMARVTEQSAQAPMAPVATPKPDGAAGRGKTEAAPEATDGIPISGIVVGVDKKPITGAELYGFTVGSPDRQRATSTADGTFRISGIRLPSAEFHLMAGAKGFAISCFGPVPLPSEGIEDFVVVLHLPCAISGTVKDIHGQAVTGCEVKAVAVPGEDFQPSSATTDTNGGFAIDGLHPGVYQILVGFPSEIVPGHSKYRVLDDETSDIELREGERKSGVNLVYKGEKPSLAISGRVTDTHGKPLENVHIWVSTNEGVALIPVDSDSNGEFEVSGLCEGLYRLQSALSGYENGEMKDISAGSTGVDIVLGDTTTIHGHVIRADTRRPVTEFEVLPNRGGVLAPPVQILSWWKQLRVSQLESRVFSVNNVDGAFTLKDVRPGDMTVFVLAKGFGLGSTSYVGIAAGQAVPDAVIELAPEAVVEGKVVDEEGHPIVGARLFTGCIPEDRSCEHDSVSASGIDGVFVVHGLPGGMQIVGGYHPDYAPATISVDAKAGALTRADIVLVRGGAIEGTVMTAGEAAVSERVMVEYPRSRGFIPFDTRTDESGHFKFERLAPGELEVVWVRRSRAGEAPGETERVERKAVSVEDGKTRVVEFSVAAE